MASLLYLIGGLGLLIALIALVTSPILMVAPANSAILAAILILAFARLIELTHDIKQNTLQVARHLRSIREFSGDKTVNYPDSHRGIRYRREVDGSVSALSNNGEEKRFQNWKHFSRAVEANMQAANKSPPSHQG